MRDLIFKEKLVKKLTEKYVGLYKIEKVILKSTVKLKLLASMRIYLVVNISRVERYRELIKEQRVKELKLVEVKEWKVEKILNKQKVREVTKYLVRWKEFTVENNTQEREEDLKNTKKLVN